MNTALSSRDVADYFLANVEEESGDSLSNLKLQKLVYYAQGICLGMRGEPIFSGGIEAWDHGPVVPSLYHAFKHRGFRSIEPPERFDAEDYAPEDREILNAVLKVYGQFSAWKLRDMTHEEPPWKLTPRNCEISHSALREFFGSVVEYGRSGKAVPGEPVWPSNAFRFQSRREISRAMARHRSRLGEAARKAAPETDPWADE